MTTPTEVPVPVTKQDIHDLSIKLGNMEAHLKQIDTALRGTVSGDQTGLIQRLSMVEVQIRSTQDTKRWATRTLIAAVIALASGLIIMGLQLTASGCTHASAGRQVPEASGDVSSVLQFILLSAAIGLSTQVIKLTVVRLSLFVDRVPEWVEVLGEVLLQRLLPYFLAVLLWVVVPEVYRDAAHSMGLVSQGWWLIVAILAAGGSSFTYSLAKDWLIKRSK